MTDVATWLEALLRAQAVEHDKALGDSIAILDAFETSASEDCSERTRRLRLLQIGFTGRCAPNRLASPIQADIAVRLNKLRPR